MAMVMSITGFCHGRKENIGMLYIINPHISLVNVKASLLSAASSLLISLHTFHARQARLVLFLCLVCNDAFEDGV